VALERPPPVVCEEMHCVAKAQMRRELPEHAHASLLNLTASRCGGGVGVRVSRSRKPTTGDLCGVVSASTG
jgi:hypothetical protein